MNDYVPPIRTDGIVGRPTVGVVFISVLPYLEGDARPLGVLQVVLTVLFYIDTLLGLDVYEPR